MKIIQNIKRNWLSYFIYISIIFLIITLYCKEYIIIPDTVNYNYLLLSFFILFAGVFAQGISYKIIMKNFGYYISAKDSIIAFGMTVLARYMPGKFWVHLGRAGYIQKKYNYPFNELAYISLNSQFIGIWLVVLFSSLGFMMIDISVWVKILIGVLWSCLTLIIFTRYFHHFAQWLVLKIAGKQIRIPSLSIRENLRVFPVIFSYWFLYALAFYVLAIGFDAEVEYMAILYFPLSLVIGIVAIFAPGGLGVREVTLVGLFTIDGMSLVLATTITAFSRIWFLTGEIFAFLIGVLLNATNRKKPKG